MIIDTHCHYNIEPLSLNISNHWQKAQDNGIEATINVGTDLENSKLALKIAKKFPKMYASIGLHPGNFTQAIKLFLDGDKYSQQKIDQYLEDQLAQLEKLLKQELRANNPKLVAVGEIGLDYYRLKNKGIKRDLVVAMQKKAFEAQLKLALKHDLVAIIHVRDQKDRQENNAYLDTLSILKEVSSSTERELKFVLHCISGPLKYVKQVIALGAYVGIAGNITYDNADDLKAIIKIVPHAKILLETDAPYLTPKGLMSQICEPYMIKITADYLAQEMNLNLDIIKQNSINLFSNINI